MRYSSSLVGALLATLVATAPVMADDPVASTVEGLFQNKTELSGKQVQIKGKVVKVNNGIMQRNFLHVQDGTGAAGTNDITVTSQQTASVGDNVVITGQLVTDLDFGAGYTYPLIIEQASIETASK